MNTESRRLAPRTNLTFNVVDDTSNVATGIINSNHYILSVKLDGKAVFLHSSQSQLSTEYSLVVELVDGIF